MTLSQFSRRRSAKNGRLSARQTAKARCRLYYCQPSTMGRNLHSSCSRRAAGLAWGRLWLINGSAIAVLKASDKAWMQSLLRRGHLHRGGVFGRSTEMWGRRRCARTTKTTQSPAVRRGTTARRPARRNPNYLMVAPAGWACIPRT
jgi:hypothetical protein